MAHGPDQSAAPATEPTGRRSCLRRAGMGCATLLLVLIVAWAVAYVWTEAALQAELDRIRAAGEPLTLAEAAPAPVPDDQNAAVPYQQVFDLDFDQYGGELTLDKFADPRLIADFLRDGAHEQEVRAVLAEPRVAAALDAIRQASQRPHCVFPVHRERGMAVFFPQLTCFRRAAGWTTARAKLAALDGDGEEALSWTETTLRVSAHAAQEPVQVAQMTAWSMQLTALTWLQDQLPSFPQPSASAERLRQSARAIDRRADLQRAFLGQQALLIQFLTDLDHNPQRALWPFQTIGWPTLIHAYPYLPARPLRNADVLACLREHEALVSIAERRLTRMARQELVEDAMRRTQSLLLAVTPNLTTAQALLGPLQVADQLLDRRDRAIAQLDLLDVALRLAAFRAMRGHYPEALHELQAASDEALPMDVFIAQPLNYRRESDGFLLYSVGVDCDDDGGVAPASHWVADGDIVWEVRR